MTAGGDRSDQRAIDPETIARARADVASVELDGEVVLYDDRSRRLHRLNPTAAALWRCLDGSVPLRQIAADIADVYKVGESVVLPQVITIAHSFARQGLLE